MVDGWLASVIELEFMFFVFQAHLLRAYLNINRTYDSLQYRYAHSEIFSDNRSVFRIFIQLIVGTFKCMPSVRCIIYSSSSIPSGLSTRFGCLRIFVLSRLIPCSYQEVSAYIKTFVSSEDSTVL